MKFDGKVAISLLKVAEVSWLKINKSRPNIGAEAERHIKYGYASCERQILIKKET